MICCMCYIFITSISESIFESININKNVMSSAARQRMSG